MPDDAILGALLRRFLEDDMVYVSIKDGVLSIDGTVSLLDAEAAILGAGIWCDLHDEPHGTCLCGRGEDCNACQD